MEKDGSVNSPLSEDGQGTKQKKLQVLLQFSAPGRKRSVSSMTTAVITAIYVTKNEQQNKGKCTLV